MTARDVFLVANNIEELGGVQRVTDNLARMLQDAGHRVTVVGIQHAKVAHDYGARPYRHLVLNEESEPLAPEMDRLAARLEEQREIVSRGQVSWFNSEQLAVDLDRLAATGPVGGWVGRGMRGSPAGGRTEV